MVTVVKKIFSAKNHPNWSKLILIVAISLPILQNTAIAGTDLNNYSDYPMDFSLSFSHSDLDLKKNSTTYSVDQRRISAILYDITNPSFTAGLILGSSYLSLNTDPVTAGLSLNGYHIGLAMNAHTRGNPQLGLHGYYLFQETEGSNNLRRVTMNWNEWLAETLFSIAVTPRWGFKLGAGMSGVDTERRVSGDINGTLRMKSDMGFQGKVEIEYHPYPSGRISLVFNRGIYAGTRFIFARTF
jgi:hypothetical protein